MKNTKNRCRGMRTLSAAAVTAAAFGLGACGGSDEGDSTSADSSVPTEEIEALSTTYEDFSVMLEDDKEALLREAMAATPSCDDNEYSYDLLLIVSSDAATSKQAAERTIGERIEEACTP